MRPAAAFAACLAAAILASCASRPAATTQQPRTAPPSADPAAKETLAHIERIRAIKPGADSKLAIEYNRQLEVAWRYFSANPRIALPVVRQELGREMTKPARNDLVLLDLGYYLHEKGEAADKALAKSALFALDPGAEILRWNRQEFFHFVHAVAADRDPRVLDLIDLAFLRNDVAVMAGDPAFKLDPTLACAFLYGVFGPDSEVHLRRQLRDRNLARRIIEVLIWIGSPESNGEVRAAMTRHRDPELFVRGATFLMNAGGPDGRRILLSLNPKALDSASQEYLSRIRKSVEATSYAQLRRGFVGLPGEAWVEPNELKKRLASMVEGKGSDGKTGAAAYLNSELPHDFLAGELVRARARLFREISPETIKAVQRTNDTINALRYR